MFFFKKLLICNWEHNLKTIGLAEIQKDKSGTEKISQLKLPVTISHPKWKECFCEKQSWSWESSADSLRQNLPAKFPVRKGKNLIYQR